MVYVLKDFPIVSVQSLSHMHHSIGTAIGIAEMADRSNARKKDNYFQPVHFEWPDGSGTPKYAGDAYDWWFDYQYQCVRCTLRLDDGVRGQQMWASPVAANGEFRSIALLRVEPYPRAPRIDKYQPKEAAVPVQPLEDRVLIKLDPQPTVSAGGIALPNTQEKDQTTGEVLAVGPGRRNDRGDLVPMTVQVGQRVLFSKYGGLRVEQAGEDVVVMREHELFAVLTGAVD